MTPLYDSPEPEEPPSDPREPDLPGEGLGEGVFGEGLAGALAGFVAEGRVVASAERRRREHWLGRQASEEASLVGVLVDLAEGGVPVALQVRSGRAHHGRIEVVGADFVVVGRDEQPDVVVVTAAVLAVRRADDGRRAGLRPLAPGQTFVNLLENLCGRREHVVLVTGDACTVAGTMWSLGRDFVTVRPEEGGRATTYVPVDAIEEVVLA